MYIYIILETARIYTQTHSKNEKKKTEGAQKGKKKKRERETHGGLEHHFRKQIT